MYCWLRIKDRMRELSYLSLHVSRPYLFSGLSSSYEDADYVVVGVPYDRTSTYRAGARFAPHAIREASANIETFSVRTGIDVEDLRICDLGDLSVTDNPKEVIERIRLVVNEILSQRKMPVILGGEHSVSLGGVKAAGADTTVVDFDAHMDLRNEYNGESLSHAAVMRRISEFTGTERIVQVGTRAFCREEVEFSRANSVRSIPALDIHRMPLDQNLARLKDMLEGCGKIYLTIDMDALDPAYAPAVGNPEADGLSLNTALSFIEEVCTGNVIAIDLTEVTPHYDTGATAVQAARILFESLCFVQRHRKGSPGLK